MLKSAGWHAVTLDQVAEDALERLITRAALIAHNVGVVDAALGAGTRETSPIETRSQ